MYEPRVRTGKSGTFLIVRSETLDADLDAVERGEFEGIECNDQLGFRPDDLQQVSRRRGVRAIALVFSRYTASHAHILSQMDWLTLLTVSVSGTGGPPVDLSRHADLRVLSLEWNRRVVLPVAGPLASLHLWKYAPASGDLTGLSSLVQLQRLELVQGSVRSVRGLPAGVRMLEFHYLRSLTDLSALALAPGLTHLKMDHCRLAATELVRVAPQLSELEILWLTNSGSLPSVAFVSTMPAIREFNGYGTEVLDGNLLPLLSLRWANVKDKKGYSHKRKDLPGYVPEV